jgi:hypothetical protein
VNRAASIESLRAAAEAADAGLGQRPMVAVGWATIDLERSIAMAGVEDGSEWAPATRDALLGARSARRSPVPVPAPTRAAAGDEAVEVVLLEPDTEGLLAATLARFGEGLAVAWFAPDPDPSSGARRPPLSPAGATPFGPGRRLLGGPAWGPHVVVLEPRTP